LTGVLRYPFGWLNDVNPFTSAELQQLGSDTKQWEARQNQIDILRKQCLPHITFLLWRVLHYTGKYRQCLNLAVVIADKSEKLDSVFRPDEMKIFLQLIRESSLALLQQTNLTDPLGY